MTMTEKLRNACALVKTDQFIIILFTVVTYSSEYNLISCGQ